MFQMSEESQSEEENASGLAKVKFPWPSLSRTATCLCNQAVLTSRSSALSPFTSRATICKPPTGAETPKLCAAPAVKRKRIEYRAQSEELPFWISTVAKSGWRSPSKSAMTKCEVRPAEEVDGGTAEAARVQKDSANAMIASDPMRPDRAAAAMWARADIQFG